MVPVETGVAEPCEGGSRGSLIRWAAAHLDDPRQVTPFALDADRAAMHAADASGTLLHGATFERARETLSDGRTVLVVCDGTGPLDPITPSLTMLDLFARWQLGAVLVEPVSRWTVGHVRLLASALAARDVSIRGVVLADDGAGSIRDTDAVAAIQETLGAMLSCPVLLLPTVMSLHDRGELLTAARECGMHRLTSTLRPRAELSAPEESS
jgi:dethiobiotin synthetase